MWSGTVRMLMGLFVVLGMSAPVGWASDELTKVAEPAGGQSAMALIGQLKSACQELNLNGETRSKIDAILAKATEDAEKARKDAKDERAAYGKISDVMRGATVDVMRLLDDDQKLMFQSKMRAAAAVDIAVGPSREVPNSEVRAVPIAQRIRNAVAPLQVSDEQSKKIDGVIKDLEEKIRELRKGAAGVTELREKILSMRQDLMTQMRGILTPEQFAKFQENVKQSQNAPNGTAGAGEKLVTYLQRLQAGTRKLGLSEEQKAKLDVAFNNAKEKLMAIGVKLQNGPTPELREEFNAVYQELKTRLQSVLTPEQWKELETSLSKNGSAGNSAGTAEKNAEKKQ